MTNIGSKKYHFTGAGGIGMSALAKMFLAHGATITGSDQQATSVTDSLISLGADVKIGHFAENITQDLDALVISAAIRPDNPEVLAAQGAKIPVIKYAEMLGKLMYSFDGVAICGTHGKSSTSGWLAYVLKQAQLTPNFIIGADIVQLQTNSGVGDPKSLFVAEACEFDRSFLNLHPKIAVILNIEQDHLDYYKDEDDIVDAFTDFAHGVKEGGTVILNGQDPNTLKVLSRLKPDQKSLTFGMESTCDLYADNIRQIDGCQHFDVFYQGVNIGSTKIALPGRHNVFNALAVIAVTVAAEIEPNKILPLMHTFTGMDRRLMLKAKCDGITIMDDYAHHPTEIKAALQAIRQSYSPKRVLCIFQPHQYSRTRFLLDDFAESFKLADITIVPQIYFVRDTEENRKLVNAQVLVDRIKENNCQAEYINTFEEIVEYLKTNLRPGDLVVTMGAGDIWKVADEYIQWFGKNS